MSGGDGLRPFAESCLPDPDMIDVRMELLRPHQLGRFMHQHPGPLRVAALLPALTRERPFAWFASSPSMPLLIIRIKRNARP